MAKVGTSSNIEMIKPAKVSHFVVGAQYKKRAEPWMPSISMGPATMSSRNTTKNQEQALSLPTRSAKSTPPLEFSGSEKEVGVEWGRRNVESDVD
jgi:hypothetical protein